MAEMMIEDDGESGEEGSAPSTPRKAGDRNRVLEEEEEETSRSTTAAVRRGDMARKALDELYLHEVGALFMCFTAPLLATLLLHAVRNLLSRPSEGLVSNYNLTIFMLAAEIGPLSHLIKLVQARTLHLQRLVHSNPYREGMVTPTQVRGLTSRLEDLEARMGTMAETVTAAAFGGGGGGGGDAQKQARQGAAMERSVRNSIQPELDALNRAVRRYEKKATVLASLTEARLNAIDTRVNDAISLAAAAAKMNSSQRGLLTWLGGVMDALVWMLMLPVHALLRLCVLPLRVLTSLLGGHSSGVAAMREKKMQAADANGVSRRHGSKGVWAKGGTAEKMPSRLPRR